MTMKRIIIIFLSILLLVIIGTGLDVFLKSNQAKKEVNRIVDDYLIAHKLTEKVQTKETLYDSKVAEYSVQITFNDEPENVYEFSTYGNKVYSIIAYDEKNVQITDQVNAKYIKDDH